MDNRAIVGTITASLFATGLIIVLLLIYQNLAKPNEHVATPNDGQASIPSHALISKDEAVQVALRIGEWNKSLLEGKTVKANLLHVVNNGFDFLVDEKTLEDKSLHGKLSQYSNNDKDLYFWSISITGQTSGEWSYLVNATDGRLLESNEPKFTSMDLDVYGSYDPRSLAYHFLKGHISSGSDMPIGNGTIIIYVNGVEAGSTSPDEDGCFQFDQWNNDKISNLIQNITTDNIDTGRSDAYLRFKAVYIGDKDHFPAKETVSSTMYLYLAPLAPAAYEASFSPPHSPGDNNTIQVRQGDKADYQLNVKALFKEAEVKHMAIDIQRLPCGVSYSSGTTSSSLSSAGMPEDQVTMDHPGTFHITFHAKDSAKPGKYFLKISQDVSSGDNHHRLPHIEIGGFEFEVLPK